MWLSWFHFFDSKGFPSRWRKARLGDCPSTLFSYKMVSLILRPLDQVVMLTSHHISRTILDELKGERKTRTYTSKQNGRGRAKKNSSKCWCFFQCQGWRHCFMFSLLISQTGNILPAADFFQDFPVQIPPSSPSLKCTKARQSAASGVLLCDLAGAGQSSSCPKQSLTFATAILPWVSQICFSPHWLAVYRSSLSTAALKPRIVAQPL